MCIYYRKKKMAKNDIHVLLSKLKDKSLTQEEFQLLKELLNDSSLEGSTNEALQTMWENHTDNYIDDSLKSEILSQIESFIDDSKSKRGKQISLKKTLSWAVAGIACLFLFNYYLFTSLSSNNSSANNLVVQTAYGERASIYLPDSSVITLNGGTKVQYPQSFGTNHRKIQFEGEAYFKVAKDEKSTFTVQIENYKVEVLGTEFNVNTAYNINSTNETSIALNLLTGKVRITPDDTSDSYYIEPGEKAIYNKETGAMNISKMDNLEIAWLSKKLIFNSATLNELLQELERTYGVSIHSSLPDYVLDDQFTAVFDNKNINEIIHTLKRYYKFNYSIEGKEIYISPQ